MNRMIATLGVGLAIPLLALAQDPAPPAAAPAAEAPPTAAEKSIDAAIDKLRSMKSATADLKVVADMLSQKVELEGEYKKAPGNRVWLLLTLLGHPNETDRMLQVCDGVTLWNFATVLKSTTCSKHELAPILKVVNGPNCDAETREEIMSGLGLAGPEALLSGLRKAFLFDQSDEGEFEGQKVWILRGSWKDIKTPILPGGNPAVLPGPLPPYVPGLVTLYLGREDGWPYRVIFEGRMPAQIEQKKKVDAAAPVDPAGGAVPAKKAPAAGAAKPSKVVLTYSKVKIGAVVADDTFAFSPPEDVKPVNMTEQFVSQLEAGLAAAAERKKQQTEKSGPVLEGGLSAPPAGGDAPAKPDGTTPKG